MRLKVDLDPETAEQLKRLSRKEHRPLPMQAELILREGVGLPDLRPGETRVMTVTEIEKNG